jgi:hypothetical protein
LAGLCSSPRLKIWGTEAQGDIEQQTAQLLACNGAELKLPGEINGAFGTWILFGLLALVFDLTLIFFHF